MSETTDSRGSGFHQSPTLVILGRLTAAALGLISAPIVARAIGPEGRGETAAALAVFSLIPVGLGIGLPTEIRRRAATSKATDSIRSAKLIVALSSFIAFGLACVLFFTVFSEFDASARFIAALGSAITPLSVSWAIDVSVLVARRRYVAVMAMQVIQQLVFVIAILAVVHADIASVATVLVANILGTITAFVTGAILVQVPFRGTFAPIVPLLRSAFHYFGASIAESASNRLDQVLALPLLGSYAAGMYSVATTIGGLPLAFGHAIAASYFTPIARSPVGLQRRNEQASALRAATSISIMIIPLMLIASWFGIPVVFGDDFRPAIMPTFVVLTGSGLMLISYVASQALAADGRGGRMTIAQIIAITISTGLLLLLGPAFGALGAAIASTVGYISLYLALLTMLKLGYSTLPKLEDFLKALKRLLKD